MIANLDKPVSEIGVAQVTLDPPVTLGPVWGIGTAFYAFEQCGQCKVQVKANAVIGKVINKRSTIFVSAIQLTTLQKHCPVTGMNAIAIQNGIVFKFTDGEISDDLKVAVVKPIIHHMHGGKGI